MQGSRFCSAISCARVCLRAVIGKYDPPFTVASLQMIITSRPSTRPIPVMIPAPGAWSSYIPCAANGDSSRNGDPRSSSRPTRSRGSSFPRPECLAAASGPPPARTRSNWRSRSAAMSAWARRFCWNASLEGLAWLRSTTLTLPPPRARRATGPGRPDLPRPRARRARWRPRAPRSSTPSSSTPRPRAHLPR